LDCFLARELLSANSFLEKPSQYRGGFSIYFFFEIWYNSNKLITAQCAA